jgi:glycosyltransferase involved in cell wall biosynthesis
MGMKNPQLVYGGVDTTYFEAKNTQTMSRVVPHVNKKFSSEDIIVTFLGRMIYSKGPHILYEIAEELLSKYQNLYFIFAGNGEMYKKLLSQKQSNIYFTGTLEKPEIKDLLSATDIFVHPSLHHEGFPNVILEAGASGCAVVATDMGGTKEIIINNETGILTQAHKEEIKKAIITFIENKELRESIGKKLRQHIVENFDWEGIATNFSTYLEEDAVTVSVPQIRFLSSE